MVTRRPPTITIPPAVENLRTLFKRAHDDLGFNAPKLSGMLLTDLEINWPKKELYRFLTGETKRIRRSPGEVDRMDAYLRMMLRDNHIDPVSHVILSPGQQKLIASGVIDMTALAAVIEDELTRQVAALAKGPTLKV